MTIEEKPRQEHDKTAAAESISSIGQIASGIAYQLRNPLSVLNNAVYYLKMKLDTSDEKINGYLSIMSEEIKRASNIINGLLHFVRLTSPQKEKKTLRSIITAAMEDVHINDNIHVTISYDDRIPPLFMDIGLVKEAICSVIDNAIESMPHGGTLTIETKKNSRYAAICISDTGCGIAARDMGSIFEPLYTTKARQGGTGIGLPLCKSITEAHGGYIEVESMPEKGSSFTIQLPISIVAS